MPNHKVPLEDGGLQWTNPLFFAEFRRKFLTRVYFFLTFQWFVVTLSTHLSFALLFNEKDTELILHISYGFITALFLFISFLLLCCYRWNNLDSPYSSMLMQVNFTVALAIFFSTNTFAWESYVPMYTTPIITLCCFISALLYYHKMFECHLLYGVCFIFYVQLFVVGLVMSVTNDDGIILQSSICGFFASSCMMLYLQYGTMQLILCKFAHFKLEDYVYGTTLIYTNFLIPFYYKVPIQNTK